METETKDKSEIENFKDQKCIVDLAFLAHTTAMLNTLNLQLQSKERNSNHLSTILPNFKTKLFIILSEIQEEDFPDFPKTLQTYNHCLIFAITHLNVT